MVSSDLGATRPAAESTAWPRQTLCEPPIDATGHVTNQQRPRFNRCVEFVACPGLVILQLEPKFTT